MTPEPTAPDASGPVPRGVPAASAAGSPQQPAPADATAPPRSALSDTTPPPRPALSDTTPPPRPALSDTTPPPVGRAVPAPAALRVAQTLWTASITAGLIAAFFAVVDRAELRGHLRDLVAERDPDRAAADLAALASMVHYGTVGAVAVITLLEVWWLRRLSRRRRGTRLLQGLTVALHTPVALLALAFLALPGSAGLPARLLLAGQLVLAAAALAAGLSPTVGAWLRGGTGRGGAAR